MADQWRGRNSSAGNRSPADRSPADRSPADRANIGKAVPLNARVIRSDDIPGDQDGLEILRTSGLQADQAVRPASGQIVTPQASRSPISEARVTSRAVVSSRPTAESTAAESLSALRQSGNAPLSELPSASYTWNDSYHQRMSAVMPNQPCGPSCEDQGAGVVEWWHENSVTHQMNNRHLVKAVVQPEKIRQFVADHTLPPQIEPDQAFYDLKPRYVELGPVKPVSSQQVSEDPDSQVARLTRDITRIQPTLGYALEGIREDQLPDDFFERMDNGTYAARSNAPTVLQWAPTNMYHNPLYFEDPALERYGHTYHPLIQPFASSGRFATQLVGLPYQMVLHPVHSKEYPLGYYRPGDYAPKKLYQIPFNEEASLMQIAVVAGLILIFP